ncbi:MAG: hypothetical protein LBQ73_02935 [Tannerellaceae bacterium]|jgi:hypothetical protein|nr:hypothetical protein [Tannerellaceae bacterium]
MKIVKISLAVVVVALIGFFLWKWWIVEITPPQQPPLPKNPFTERIEEEINSFDKLPDDKFCKEFYSEVGYHIDDYHKQGRLGSNQPENDQWKENLSKNLYSAYVDKFIRQAFYVFRGSEWDINALAFIRSEYQTLRASAWLESGSLVDEEFVEIQTIFAQYDEIAGFISSCKSFSYSGSSLSDRFPLADVVNKMSRAATYRNNGLGNEYVNNCTRLRDELRGVPQTLFRAHVRYLDNKIDQWSGLYSNYNSQPDYANNLYKPLKSEIDALDNNIYKLANFEREYNRLSKKWSDDNIKANNYSYPTR